MFELTFLGTSSSAPSVYRGLSSHLITHEQYRFLLDCGEGTQRQILRSGLGFKRLDTVLLTHGHLDHILGLGGLLSTLARWENLDEINVYGGKQTLARVNNLLKVVFPGHKPPTGIHLNRLKAGESIVENGRFQLSAFPVLHRGSDSYGYIFNEKERRPFLAEKADALGVPFGPERGRLAAGDSITLENGRIITPDDVLGEHIPGVKYVHIGDIGVINETVLTACKGADVLVMESTFISNEADMAKKFGHMTAVRSAALAKESGVKTLILTHLSRRYGARQIQKEARAIFPHTYVANDFDQFHISKDGAVLTKNLLHKRTT